MGAKMANQKAQDLLDNFDRQGAIRFLRDHYEENNEGLGDDELYAYLDSFGSMTDHELKDELNMLA